MKIENIQTETTYPLKKPNNKPNVLSIGPTSSPNHNFTKTLPTSIVTNSVKL